MEPSSTATMASARWHSPGATANDAKTPALAPAFRSPDRRRSAVGSPLRCRLGLGGYGRHLGRQVAPDRLAGRPARLGAPAVGEPGDDDQAAAGRGRAA